MVKVKTVNKKLNSFFNEKLSFLLEDENILEAEISDVIDKYGRKTVGLSIVVGELNNEITPNLKNKKPKNKFFEIILTKDDLKKISELLKQH